MKKPIPKKLSALIIMMIFSFTFANAQTCPVGKVWACRISNCVQECKCVNANNVTNWQANGQPCQPCFCIKPIPAICRPHCSPFRISANGATNETVLTDIYPNPVSQSATISFSLEQSEKISVKIFDMTGRIVQTLADGLFAEGENKIEWNVENENPGIYFLRMDAEDYSHIEKLSIIK
ncbi:MAG: T9SS type A sorting domain-containing protein [Bacteroidota bacterium]